jgi:RNA polymerase sigma-70 factor (ECF subfamily)
MHSANFSLRYIENRPVGQSDLGLVMAARTGSEAAFTELHRLYARRLYKKIFSITKNHEDAEDVLQETLMRAYLALASFEGRSQFLSWLTRIAINTSLMALRKRRVRHEGNFASLSLGGDEVAQLHVKDPNPNPEESCLLLETSFRTFRAISELKLPLRTVLQIQMSQECSLNEIATSLDVSVAAVKSRLYRARRRVADRTKDEVRILPSRTGTNG